MTRIMNKTTLVFVAALAASTLIIGTMGTLQPAAAYHHKNHLKQSNNLDVNQANYQVVRCDYSGSGNCNNNYQQAANTVIFSHSGQENQR
jgi:hypothetical protein